MKNTLIYLLILCTTVSVAQSNCSKYYPLQEGASYQLTYFNKRDKVMSIADYDVLEVQDSSNGVVGTIKSTARDKNGEEIGSSNFDVICNGDLVSIDNASLINPQMLEQFGSMDYEVTGTNLDFPNQLSVGQSLPDAAMEMKINMSGITMNMSILISDRKVVGEETVTTAAGTYDCFVITSTTDTKMGVNLKTSTKQWIAEKVGLVKSENYDRRGNKSAYSLLTKFTE